jgi:S-(hydroxymethyl)glutathione dehydrogenase/alcohol dehydrogenase
MASPIVCKAAISWAPKEDPRVEDVQVGAPQKGEVRIRVHAAAVCHTDLYTHYGHDPEGIFPVVLGHEGAGVVESVGEGVTSVSVGDHVVPLYIPECRTCKFCTSNKTNLCSIIRVTQGKGLMPDGTTRLHARDPSTGAFTVPLFHFMGCSTFAEYAVMPEISLAVIPKEAPLDRACLLGCGLTTGYGAVLNTCKVEKGAVAAVFGLGAVGLAAVLGLRAAGARRIIAVDVNPAKFPLAKDLGGDAVEFLNPADPALAGKRIQDVLIEMTTEDGAGGVDYSFECIGRVDTMRAALEATHKGWGVSCIIGVAASGQEISTRPFQLVTGRTWKGSAFGGVKGRSELPGLVAKMQSGEIPVSKFVSHEMKGIASVVEAIHVMHDPTVGAIRPVITY